MNNEDISKPFLLSLLAHLTLVLLFTVKAVFFPTIEEIYQPPLRVDIVGLPDKITPIDTQDQVNKAKEEVKPDDSQKSKPIHSEETPLPVVPTPPKAELLKPKDKEKADLVLNPKKDTDKNKKELEKSNTSQAIEKLKKKMAIDKIKEDIKQDIKQKERQELSQRISQYKGNVLAPGTELTGVVKLQHENYLGQIDHHVKQFWSLPEWLARGNFKAKVKIFIDSRGLLLRVELISTSGNSSYDDIVIETVKKAVPYPVPPEKFRDIISVSGMILGFPE